MQDITESEKPVGIKTAVALGLFDGVHLGHRRVLDKAAALARENGIKPAVFTFNTASVTSKSTGRIEQLTTDEGKRQRLEALGFEYVYSPQFEKLKDMDAERFVGEILKDKLGARYAVCGENFSFGRGGSADSKTLCRLCKKYGIETAIESRLQSGGEVVSSTLIRELIKNGGISRANELLGYNFGFCAKVEHGNEIGRTWDFPTINQRLPEGLVLPKFGVYCSKTLVGGEWKESITNIGIKPTVGGLKMPLAETFIINYSGDLYGEDVALTLFEFVRPERVFDSFDGLKAEIARNTEFVKEYFGIK